jgi:hypothetical protein
MAQRRKIEVLTAGGPVCDDRMLKDIGLTRTDGEFLLSYALQSWIARSERTYGSKPFEYYGGFPLF